MQVIKRGNDVLFTDTFTNTSGTAFVPSSASVTVTYEIAGIQTTDDIAMVLQDDGSWQASWSSGMADAGLVQWAVNAAGATKAEDEGSFMLSANAANRQSCC